MRTAPYCIVYRTGGRSNFTWHRSLAMTRDEARAACAGVERMGYRCVVERYEQSVRIGLPETFDAFPDPVFEV